MKTEDKIKELDEQIKEIDRKIEEIQEREYLRKVLKNTDDFWLLDDRQE